MSARHRMVVCGTTFGRVHLAALAGPQPPAELAGILARGSARSVAMAAAAGVPLFRSVDELPADVDTACVAIRAGVVGGAGTELALALLRRGVHVLAEHPVHRDELARCLRQARESGVSYRLNDHYPHVEAVARFISAAHALYAYGPPRWIDAATGIQVAYALVDILGRALPAVRPWGFTSPADWPAALTRLSGAAPPLRSVDGVFGGVPLTLRVHNEVDPRDPDNHAHLLHRVTIGTDAGNLTLLNTHGPVIWSPRLHVPGGSAAELAVRPGPHGSGLASAVPLGAAAAPSFDHIVRDCWPLAMREAIAAWLRDVEAGVDPLRRGQHDLTLCEVWQDLTGRLGQPRLVEGTAPPTVGPADIGDVA